MFEFTASYEKYLKDESDSKRSKTRKERVEKYGFDLLNNSNNNLPNNITILGEDGIGDEIFDAQFLPALAKQCKEVVWVFNWKDESSSNENSKLLPIFQNSFHQLPNVSFRVFRAKKNLPHNQVFFSKQLIRHFGCSEDKWKESVKTPYLSTKEDLTETLIKRYRSDGKKIIGLAWSSEGGKPGKSLPFKDNPEWKKIFDKKNSCSFISLQYGDVADSINYVRYMYGVEIYHDAEMHQLNNLEHTAAQINACDIVVSISTTAAHLAGALAKNSLLLLPANPFVHWKFDCAYPSIRRIEKLCLVEGAEKLESLL